MNHDHKTADQESPIHFLVELRSRVIRSILLLGLIFLPFAYYANDLYSFLVAPLVRYLPKGHLIATQIVAPFFAPFKLAFVLALFIAVPYFLYQIWVFIAPALYRKEKRVLWPFIFLSTILFYCGLAFAYFVIFPLLFHFLANAGPKEVILSPDINEYLNFTLKLLLIFGTIFEIPIAMLLIVLSGWVHLQTLKRMRSYAIITAFILGMLLAPPDVISQTLLAIPIWLLFEFGLLLCHFLKPLN